MAPREAITDLLLEARGGESAARERLYTAVYEDLRRIAHRQLQGERPDHTFGTTGLVHETYMRLADLDRLEWQDRAQFFRAAAGAMRRILVDYARRHRAVRRGGGVPHDFLDDNVPAAERGDMLVAVDEALERLARLSPRMSGVVECRFFGGLTEEETAEALGISARTVQRERAKSRAWLYSELCD